MSSDLRKGLSIALIPARGGSKRIPRKNIKLLAGQPILSMPITAARESGLFDAIIVTTDDDEISDVARACGVDHVIRRQKDLADDNTPLRPVIRQSINEIETDFGLVGKLCCIYATAAFLFPEDLKKGYMCLDDDQVDYSVSSVQYPHPIQRAYHETLEGGVAMTYPEKRVVRTQDLQQHYHDAGMFFWGRRNAFFTDVSIYTAKSRLVDIPRLRAIDIDEPEDWEMAEIIFDYIYSRQS